MNSLQQISRIDRSTIYKIRVLGKLDQSWSEWLEGMAIAVEERGDGVDVTTITGAVVDQAALHGVLNRIRDLNLPLLSVQLVKHRIPGGLVGIE